MGCARSVPSARGTPSGSSPLHNHTGESAIIDDNANKENINTNNVLEKDLKLKINNYMGTENKTERELPSCDNLEESLDIYAKNENVTSSSPLEDLTLDDFDGKDQENMNKVTEIKVSPEDKAHVANEITEKEELVELDQNANDKEYRKFEEIVEDIVKMSDAPNVDINLNSNGKSHDNASEIMDVSPIEIEDLTEIELEGMEDEVMSASSEGRATRWEALADIAAELPPSLTVDPLTGQIYAVSK